MHTILETVFLIYVAGYVISLVAFGQDLLRKPIQFYVMDIVWVVILSILWPVSWYQHFRGLR